MPLDFSTQKDIAAKLAQHGYSWGEDFGLRDGGTEENPSMTIVVNDPSDEKGIASATKAAGFNIKSASGRIIVIALPRQHAESFSEKSPIDKPGIRRDRV